MALFPLILPTSATLHSARALHTRDGVSFWDAMIMAGCVESGITRLYSEDLPGRVMHGALEIINPFA